MKRLFTLILLGTVQFLTAQHELRFNATEFFTISGSVDPVSSINESGLDIVGEIEYVGFIYAKAGFESFSALYGGYRDVHGAVGINLTTGLYEKARFYGGIRLAKVDRGSDGAFRPIYGIEGGIDFDFTNKFFIGIRGTIDKRYDQEIFGWTPELKCSGFIRMGYKWYYRRSFSRN
jgi:hypothetical protein